MNFPKTLALVALIAAPLITHAGADFTTVRRTPAAVNDNAPRLLLNFTLPATLNRVQTTANSAVLDLEVQGSEYNFNEIYVNPPTTVCTADDTDANQAASVGFIADHDDVELRFEWAANHVVFDSALLKTGANQIMICVRNVSGGAGSGVGNLDNIVVRNAVLHYHTTP